MVIIVEKESFFVSLLSRNFFNHFPNCLFVTPKGYADIQTKEFLLLLHREIPTLKFYYLGDYDAYGVDIYLNLCFGSKLSVFEQNDLNFVEYLGLDGRELMKVDGIKSQILKKEEADEDKLTELFDRDYLWVTEEQILTKQAKGKKID